MAIRTFILILSMVSFLSMNAIERSTHIVFWDTEGSKVSYALSDEPRITFDSTDLTIEVERGTINYPLANLQQITYENQSSGISTPIDDGIDFKSSDNSIIFSNLRSGNCIGMYSANGTIIFSRVVENESEYRTDISDLVPGVYFIKVNSTTHKILIK